MGHNNTQPTRGYGFTVRSHNEIIKVHVLFSASRRVFVHRYFKESGNGDKILVANFVTPEP